MEKTLRTAPTNMMDLTIALVSYNTRNLLKNCLDSVYGKTAGLEFEVIVVDNASADGTLEMLEREFPQVRIIGNRQNLGFARANNQAIEQSKGRYLLLLNPDTLFKSGSLHKVITFMDDHSEVGALGCKILHPDGTIQPSNDNFPGLFTELFRVVQLRRLVRNPKMRARIGREWGKILGRTLGGYLRLYWDTERIREVDWVTGAFFLVRKETMQDIGLLDEDFFMYYEDADWCYRMWQKDWRIFYFPFFEIVHYVGESDGEFSAQTFIERHKSMHHFFKKHRGRSALFVLCVIISSGLALRWLGLFVMYAFQRERRHELRKRFFAYLKVIEMRTPD